jgi:hypothetical protein
MIKKIEFKCRWICKVLMWEGEKDMCKCSFHLLQVVRTRRGSTNQGINELPTCVFGVTSLLIFILF